ncbi:outer membrane beta-barrel protein [bacterium SCSIO 12696]|nr:outer membrane beta-barrel protein [bacterium SCSIO 12696]
MANNFWRTLQSFFAQPVSPAAGLVPVVTNVESPSSSRLCWVPFRLHSLTKWSTRLPVLFQALLASILLIALPNNPAFADKAPLIATVADPYLEMHSGPGRGYPIFHVVEKGETVETLKSRTDWFKVRVQKGIDGRERVGWVHRSQMGRTLSPNGEQLGLQHAGFDDFKNSRWEMGISAGDFEGASSLNGNLGYRITENITTELRLTHAIGNFSDNTLASINIQNQPFPQWRVSPYFSLGAGVIRTQPNATLVQVEDRTDSTLNVGIGARAYITRNMVLRAEYRNHVILTSRDQNEEVKEWTLGISIFY